MGNKTPKCPKCQIEGVDSSVTKDNQAFTTLALPVKYFNKDTRKWRTTSPNTITYSYVCEHGHAFEVKE